MIVARIGSTPLLFPFFPNTLYETRVNFNSPFAHPSANAFAMSNTFCILPWTQLIVRSDGEPQVCNLTLKRVEQKGLAMSVYRHSTDEIWNGDKLRQMRLAMIQGRQVAACKECYDLEQTGATSLRQHMNALWQNGFLNDMKLTLHDLKSRTGTDGQLFNHPSFLQLDVGSLCNLRCRMCNSGASSQINRDYVHRQWVGPAEDVNSSPRTWFRDKRVLAEILRHAHHVKQLHLMGGEPFLISDIGDVLHHFVDNNLASDVELIIHTNGTISHCRWIELTRYFKKCVIYLSIDGFGPYYEYIRYPAKWKTIVQNIPTLKMLPNTELRVHVVVQNYNALSIVRLFQFLDEVDITFFPQLLYEPVFLRATAMPEEARRVAAQRLRTYAGGQCRPEAQLAVRGLAEYLENSPKVLDERTIRILNLFTNDLDASRGQKFSDTHSELLGWIREAGLPWNDARRYWLEPRVSGQPERHAIKRER